MATSLDTALIQLYTGGVAQPTAYEAQNHYLARAAQDSAGRINLEYVPASAVLAPLLRPQPSLINRVDAFVGGNATSGSIGELGWNLLGSGTPAYSRQHSAGFASAVKGRPATSASTNDRTSLVLGDTEDRSLASPATVNLLRCVVNQNNSLTSKRWFFGINDDFATAPQSAVDCLGIYYDSAVSPNYQVISRNTVVGTPVDTGVAVPANTNQLITMVQPTAGTWQFYVGATLVGTISTGISTNTMNIGFRLETLANASAAFNVGYFDAEFTAAGAFDDLEV